MAFQTLASGVIGKLGHAGNGKEVMVSTESQPLLFWKFLWAQAWRLVALMALLCHLEKAPLLVGGCGSYLAGPRAQDP